MFCAAYIDERFDDIAGDDVFGESRGVTPRDCIWHLFRDQERGAVRLRSAWHCSIGLAMSGPGPTGEVAEYLPGWAATYLYPTGENRVYRIADGRGWPAIAMWGGFEVNQSIENSVYVGHLGAAKHAVLSPKYLDGEFRSDWTRVYPLMPIWKGFIINTVFYATLWLIVFLAIVGPGILRRTLRHRRGNCIQCGYDLRGSRPDQCSECGSKLLHPAAAQTSRSI